MNSIVNNSLLLGIPVNKQNMQDSLNTIMAMVPKFENDQKNRLVATANVDFIINAHKGNSKNSKPLLKILRNADLVTADGMPLVWLSKLIGAPVKERVTGADMVPALAEKAAESGNSIYLFGGANGAAKETAQILSSQYDGLKIAGTTAPMIDMDDNLENMIEIARINITNPDILLIALGNPKQELWFEKYEKYLRVPVSIGVGGTFEFISGRTFRAPLWIQKSGLEWIYRIMQDPKRLIMRYLKGLISFNFMALPLILINFISSLVEDRNDLNKINIQNKKSLLNDPKLDLLTNLKSISGIKIDTEFLYSGKILKIDFQEISTLNANDMGYLMNALLLIQKKNISVKFINLKFFPKLMLKAYKIYDLLKTAEYRTPVKSFSALQE